MRTTNLLVAATASLVACRCDGFVVQPLMTSSPSVMSTTTTMTLSASTDKSNTDNGVARFGQSLVKSVAAVLVAGSVWSSPMDSTLFQLPNGHQQDHPSITAYAKEKASGSGSRVNKDADSLLRYGLPIDGNSNAKDVRKLQSTIEDIKLDIGSKRKAAALDGAKKVATQLINKKLTATCRDASVCQGAIERMDKQTGPLQNSLKDSLDAFQGSEQERTALDQAYEAQNIMTKDLTVLEEQMVPAGYKMPVPDEYKDLPQLTGRATVEMEVVKADKAPFDINGVNFPKAKMVMVIDGFVCESFIVSQLLFPHDVVGFRSTRLIGVLSWSE